MATSEIKAITGENGTWNLMLITDNGDGDKQTELLTNLLTKSEAQAWVDGFTYRRLVNIKEAKRDPATEVEGSSSGCPYCESEK